MVVHFNKWATIFRVLLLQIVDTVFIQLTRRGCLLNFWTLRVGAYSRLGAYYIFAIIVSVVYLFGNKTINGRVSLLSVLIEWEGALLWALIRGWAIIRINTVLCQNK